MSARRGEISTTVMPPFRRKASNAKIALSPDRVNKTMRVSSRLAAPSSVTYRLEVGRDHTGELEQIELAYPGGPGKSIRVFV